jgi:hypothetical protein
MLSNSFQRYQYDSCVYLKFVNGSPTYLLLYVDDMLIAAKSMKQIAALKAQLSNEFDMKDLGAAKKILGMVIVRDRKFGLLYLSQKSYIEKVLRRSNMQNAKPVSTWLLILNCLLNSVLKLMLVLSICQKFHNLVLLGHSCMLWFALVLICLML